MKINGIEGQWKQSFLG